MSKPKLVDDGDYYFSIHGTRSDGFAVHWYRKIGWGSVTSEFKKETFTTEELLKFLSEPKNHIRPTVRAKNE